MFNTVSKSYSFQETIRQINRARKENVWYLSDTTSTFLLTGFNLTSFIPTAPPPLTALSEEITKMAEAALPNSVVSYRYGQGSTCEFYPGEMTTVHQTERSEHVQKQCR